MKCLIGFFLLVCASAGPAHACANLTPEGWRKLQTEHQRWLRKNSNKVVIGSWTLESTKELEDGAKSFEGVLVVPKKHGKVQSIKTFHIVDEINCGFPHLPEASVNGTFYLHDDGDDVLYTIRHVRAEANGE